jgi:Relaxase/Mobilisation nuclease domain
MIGKIKKGKSFAGLTKYILEKEQASLICTNLAGDTPQDFYKQFAATRQLNPRVRSPVSHISISFPPHEKPSSINIPSGSFLGVHRLLTIVMCKAAASNGPTTSRLGSSNLKIRICFPNNLVGMVLLPMKDGRSDRWINPENIPTVVVSILAIVFSLSLALRYC